MENIRYTLLIREYWNDFRKNCNLRTILSGCYYCLCILPAWWNILSKMHGLHSMIAMLLLLPCALFLSTALATHTDLMPDMFYLLPLSRSQKEQYIRRSTVVRILVPGAVCMVWFGLVSCFRFLETIGILIGGAGCLLGCAVIHLAQVVEYTRSYKSTLDGIAAFLLIIFSFLGSASAEVGQIIWGILFLLCSVHFWRLYRKFHTGCIRHSYYEAKVSEGQKK